MAENSGNGFFSNSATAPYARIGQGRDGSMAASDLRVVGQEDSATGRDLVQRRHVDFLEHNVRWRWLLDSYEGGDRYRNAVYGPDRKGLPCRNLFRHRREYPDPRQNPVLIGGYSGAMATVQSTQGSIGYGPYPGQLGADPAATAQDDDYELRRSRTPVPEFVAEAVEIHLSAVFEQEIEREGPDELVEWWANVDGTGTPIDDWMRDTIAPLLMVLGCLDVCFDHPSPPPGSTVETRSDEMELGLDACLASCILPQNMVWWKIDQAGRYLCCLVREYQDPSDRIDVDDKGETIDPDAPGQFSQAWRRNYVRYRFWNNKESILYNYDGSTLIEKRPHPFGRVPIVRLIDQKKHRTPTVGKSRYEGIAELQREYYNRDSELILSDTLQAHPLLSGPEDFCKADSSISIGPGYVLPKKKTPDGDGYEGWEYVSPDKDPADSLRKNKLDLIDMKDRRACLTKPAGVAAAGSGTGSGTTAQSGISKTLDAQTGYKVLTSIAQSLARVERQIAEYALLVINNALPTPQQKEQTTITYPRKFDLLTHDELASGLTRIQNTADRSGNIPSVETDTLKAAARRLLPGQDDAEYEQYDGDIETLVAQKAAAKGRDREGITSDADTFGGPGTSQSRGGVDPTGQSGGTSLGNTIPMVV
jgi:hypothetical protein